MRTTIVTHIGELPIGVVFTSASLLLLLHTCETCSATLILIICAYVREVGMR